MGRGREEEELEHDCVAALRLSRRLGKATINPLSRLSSAQVVKSQDIMALVRHQRLVALSRDVAAAVQQVEGSRDMAELQTDLGLEWFVGAVDQTATALGARQREVLRQQQIGRGVPGPPRITSRTNAV